jgi:hypothetical protein
MSSGVRVLRGALDRPVRSQYLVVAQLGQHPVRDRGVGGSNPFNQTHCSTRRTAVDPLGGPHTFGSGPAVGRSALDRETVVRSSIGRAPSCHGGGSGIETRLWRQTLVVKRMITGDYESPVPGSSPGRGAISS